MRTGPGAGKRASVPMLCPLGEGRVLIVESAQSAEDQSLNTTESGVLGN